MERRIEFTTRSLILLAGFGLLLWFVYQVIDILIALFVAVIIVSATHPLVERITRLRVPRGVAILLVYFLVLGVLAGIGMLLIPPLIDQSVKLLGRLPEYVSEASQILGFGSQTIDPSFLQEYIAPLSSNIVRVSVGLFSNLVGLITLAVFTFYLLLERHRLEYHLARLIAGDNHERVYNVILRIEDRLGAWVRGELTLMTLIGLLSYIGLWLLKVEFALPLAILAGLLEILPVIGPIIAAIPAILIALSTSPVLALATGALYFLVQQLENTIVVPKVMERAVGLHPLVTLLALMVGGKLAGVVGALLAVPVLVVAQTVLLDVFNKSNPAP